MGSLVAAEALQLGNEEIGDVRECFGRHREGEIESVDVRFVALGFQLVGDRRRRPDDHRPDTADRDMLGDLPHRPASR
jgi:hypothetical protein